MNEIERKFLVQKEMYKPSGKGKVMKQGYFFTDADKVVRVRIADEKGFLTIKGRMVGITRPEFEYKIPKDEAEILLGMCKNGIVEKVRYLEKYKGMIWEVDIFTKENAGLMIAEIELESENQTFEMPDWVGDEVTFDMRYYNSWLSKNPYATW